MKRFTLLTFFLFAFFGAFAQNISVKSFKALPMDMTTSSREGKRIDQNGEVAALIKVMTTQTGFVFEGGTIGIVDTKQRVSEIWVWVPHGLRKISIMHRQLGYLKDYVFPVEIEADRTYEMILATDKVETIIEEEAQMQYLAFHITPPNATLEVDGEFWSVDADGNAMKFVDFGSYSYRVMESNYVPKSGKVTVDDPDNTKMVEVNLKRNSEGKTLTLDADKDEHDYVDLGLPSGLLWATCNVGANAPEDYGDYFAWGETITKETYSEENYNYSGSTSFHDPRLIKYSTNSNYGNCGFTDNLTILQYVDDVASSHWGDGWCMPTMEQWKELIDNTTCVWTNKNGVNGNLFTASNGNSIFLPFTGYRLEDTLLERGNYGIYWSSSLYSDNPCRAWYFYSSSFSYYINNNDRFKGFSVRPVRSSVKN